MSIPFIDARLVKQLVNFLLFQIGWIVCVVYGSTFAVAFFLLALVAHFLWISHYSREWLLIVIVVSAGAAWDFTMSQLDVLILGLEYSLFIPVWLICLWGLFAMTLSHSLSWLRQRYLASALLGAFFGPASYWMGTNLSDIEMGLPLIRSLGLLGIGWAFLLPTFFLIANKLVFDSNIPVKSST
ncbi:MAG: hypothetical protein ACI845_000278 [Gammaproteobacteria bacterium]|jgi:hypothetical protein